ncbi:MAG: hypothetical protein M5U31_15480 [Acidimicrobiia bacterium]|nr:hypothetical protein [Acidimicrobiia bacterium]
MRQLGEFLVRRRVIVIVASVVLFLVAGVYGADVADQLSSGGFDNENFESSRA